MPPGVWVNRINRIRLPVLPLWFWQCSKREVGMFSSHILAEGVELISDCLPISVSVTPPFHNPLHFTSALEQMAAEITLNPEKDTNVILLLSQRCKCSPVLRRALCRAKTLPYLNSAMCAQKAAATRRQGTCWLAEHISSRPPPPVDWAVPSHFASSVICRYGRHQRTTSYKFDSTTQCDTTFKAKSTSDEGWKTPQQWNTKWCKTCCTRTHTHRPWQCCTHG